MKKEILEKELRGYYRTGCFHIYLDGYFDPDLNKMSRADLGTFLHEYVHFLQNISTPYGIFEAAALNEAAVETFIDIEPKNEIELPYDAPQSKMLKARLEWLQVMNGQRINNSDDYIQVDENKSILWGEIKQSIVGREGRLVALEFCDKIGKIHQRFIGARDIKEAMAAAYQSLIDIDAKHPDIPYNLLRIFCKQTFPTVGNDVKKFICLCYTALFSLNPAYHFIYLCHKAEDEKDKTGFQFFDEYLTDHKVMVRGKWITVWEHFNGMLEQYRQSIEGLIRCEMPYINSLLESVRLENGNVPLLNVINTDSPFSVDNVQALVRALGIPYMHAQNRGWFFPSMDGEGASDVVKLVGDTWLYQFLINKDDLTKCICPLANMCGQNGTYCYDQPWLERNCAFELLGDEIGLKNKKIVIKNMDKLNRADLAAYERKIIEKAAMHTIQLYRFSSTEKVDVIEPQPLASGIVVSFKKEYYLVTAKHVFEGEDLTKIGCFVKGQPELLGCDSVCCCGDDVAYTSLSDNIIDVLSNEKIIPYILEESIGVNLIYETNRYMLYGYPASMVKDTADKEVRSVKSFPLFTKILGKDNINKRRICLKSENMFAVDFHKDKLASFSAETLMKQIGPKPGGLSGCGLWQFDVGKFILVGIMTDYDIPKAVFLGDMINPLIESIDKRSFKDVFSKENNSKKT